MITKLASPLLTGADVLNKNLNINGFKSAKLIVTVASGSTGSLGVYITKNGTAPSTATSERALLYYDNLNHITNFSTLSLSEGEYIYDIDLQGVTNIMIAGNGFTPKLALYQTSLDLENKVISEAGLSGTTYNVRGINTLIVKLLGSTFTSSSQFSAREKINGRYAPVYTNNAKYTTLIGKLQDNYNNDLYIIDCRDFDHINILFTNTTFSSMQVESSAEIVDESKLINPLLLTTSNRSLVIDTKDKKQLDVTPTVIQDAGESTATYLSIEGSNDNFTTASRIYFYIVEANSVGYRVFPANYNKHLIANVESFEKVRIIRTNATADKGCIELKNLQVHDDYVDGRRFYYTSNITNSSTILKGYKYFKFMFLEEFTFNGVTTVGKIENCTGYIHIKDKDNNNVWPKYYDLGGNAILPDSSPMLKLYGHPTGGGVILELPRTSDFGDVFSIAATDAATDASVIRTFYIECYKEMPPLESCKKLVYSKNDYDVYEFTNSNEGNKDVYLDTIVHWSANNLTLWQYGYLGIQYTIPFNKNTVARFEDGETIKFAYLLPFNNKHRGESSADIVCLPRICVFTKKHVYHNFPVYSTDRNCGSDMLLFDESIIYNRYKRWLPVNDKSLVDSYHKYFPVLVDYDYDQFKYRIDTANSYKVEVNNSATSIPDGAVLLESALSISETGRYTSSELSSVELPTSVSPIVYYIANSGANTYTTWTITNLDPYGNGGLPAIAYDSRILHDNVLSTADVFNRICYSSITKGGQECVFGNYNVVDGSEPFVMITNQGGRIWQVNNYFACTDAYANMRGGKIDLSAITSVSPYVANSLKLHRKRFNVPTNEVKEPTTPFIVNQEEEVLVTGFSVSDGTCVVTLANDVDWIGSYSMLYFENVSAASEWNYICNTGFTADGNTNSGIFFRAEVIEGSANQYKLYADLGNAYEGDMVCRHIHGVNKVEAGILISTGESYSKSRYEGGFLYLIKQNMNNGGSTVGSLGSWPTIRLCSAIEGVNRACGAYIFSDHYDPTLLYASDEAFVPNDRAVETDQLQKRYFQLTDRTVKYPATPCGIFVGKLSDIDDQTKFDCVCELDTTIIGLLQTHGHFAFQGHAGQVGFSKDGFHWSIDVYDGSLINGEDECGNIYFGNKIAVFK